MEHTDNDNKAAGAPSALNVELDLVERLRRTNTVYSWINRQANEAADEIEKLHRALEAKA